MLIYAAVLLVLAAVGGLFMVGGYVARGRTPPLVVAGLHGVLAAAGLVLVLIPVLSGTTGGLTRASLAVLVLAALGGFYLLVAHLTRSRVPLPPALAHALVAAVGVALLVGAILGYG